MQREFNLGSLLTTLMTRSSPMRLSTVRSLTSLTRIRSTKEFWVASARLDSPQNDLCTPYYWAEELESWRRYWNVPLTKLEMRLIISWKDTKDSPISKRLKFQEMGDEVILLDWMADVFQFQEERHLNVPIYVCLGIFRMAKRS